MSAGDWAKSVFREALDKGQQLIAESGPLRAFRKQLAELAKRSLRLEEEAISRALAQLPGVQDLMVRARAGGIRVEASYGMGLDGEERHLGVSLFPLPTKFVMRGAKELSFRVDPPELADDRRCRDLVGGLSGLLATRLWGGLLPATRDTVGTPLLEDGNLGLVDQDEDVLTCDLRTVGFVRELVRRPGLAMGLEMFRIGPVAVEDGAWTLALRLPSVPG